MKIEKILENMLNVFYQPQCAACDEKDTNGLCDICRISCNEISQGCPLCALPVGGSVALVCAACVNCPPPQDSLRAAMEYGGQLAVALKRLKYASRNDIGRLLTPLLWDSFLFVAEKSDIAIPMPLHPRRLRQRGYNQSQRILLPLARKAELPMYRLALRRIKDTSSQTGKSAQERRANVRDAFRANPKKVWGKTVLLLDDIYTTGSTIEAAVRELKAQGAKEVHVFVVARSTLD